jgi:rod shape-determining protein MreC
VIRLSIPVRQALARLTLPVLIAASFGMMLLGKADALLAERARMALGDALAPAYAVLAGPLLQLRDGVVDLTDLLWLRSENAKLRDENAKLRRWQSVALALDAENQLLKAQLNWIPDSAPSYVTARVVDDAGGVYSRAALLALAPGRPIEKGQVALDAQGLVGRVTEVGVRSARILLITDLNSRIPVTLESSRGRAMLMGTNGAQPRLADWSADAPPVEGERVVTSAEAGAFPAGLPVGLVRYTANHVPEVVPFAQLDRLEVVRVFDYGLRGLLPPEANRPERPRR